jgi:long-chain acyl-CoA synthetase
MTSDAVDVDFGPTAVARRDPERVAFIAPERSSTYRDFDGRTTALARALTLEGVVEGERVAIMLPNSIEFFEVWAAAGRLGASVVLVNWHLKRDELEYLLTDSGARVLVAHEQFADVARAAAAATPCRVILAPHDLDDLIARGRGGDAAIDDCVGLASPVFYTSGTTGRPKGVVHGTFTRDVAVLAQRGQVALWGWTADDVYILSGPAYHAGPGGYVMAALFVGAATVVVPPDDRGRWDARAWLRAVQEHRVTISFMTPAHFIRLLEVPEGERRSYDLSSLRVIVHGAAPCPVAVKRQILDWFPCPVWEIYGASEGGATRISADEWRARPSRCASSTPTATRGPPANRVSSTSVPRAARASTITTTPTRPRARGATTPSRSETSATSTTTATSS